MKVLFHNVYDEINKDNILFEKPNVIIGDNLLKPFNLIPELALKHGIVVGTRYKIDLEEADLFVFIDYPKKDDVVFNYACKSRKKMILISYESPIISSENMRPDLHFLFEYVFTWSDDLVFNFPDKYIKLNYLHDIKVDFETDLIRKKKFVIISGNKYNASKNELYSLRYSCVKWFEKNNPSSLDLYGFGWDLRVFDDKVFFGRLLNRLNSKFKLFTQKLSCYKGSVNRKSDVLSDYNFSICLENVYGYNGYITEKIFDCLIAGVIPIYKGAPNISEYVPENCFINFDKFKSIEEMFDKINNMSEKDIRIYRRNIKIYLESNKIEKFESSYLSKILLKSIIKYKV